MQNQMSKIRSSEKERYEMNEEVLKYMCCADEHIINIILLINNIINKANKNV